MARPLTVLQTQSYTNFCCIQSDCEDTCCGGWGIVVDKHTYDKYRKCSDPELAPILERGIALIEGQRDENLYARIELVDGHCPLRTDDNRCRIHERLGANALSRTCATFPRAVSLVDGVLECSLYLSCPEAARKVLLDPNSMRSTSSGRGNALRFASPPSVDTGDQQYLAKPYEFFSAVRSLTVSIVENRRQPLWERLLILGLFCEHLDRTIAAGQSGEVGRIAETYAKQIEAGLYMRAFQDVPNQPSVQIEFVTKWIDACLSEATANPRFSTVYEQFKQGIGLMGDGASVDGAVNAYVQAYATWYQPFMAAHEHIFENCVLNYMLRTLFPFGPQKSLYGEPRPVFDHFVLLVTHYAILRSLMVGVAAHRTTDFDEADIVTVVQSYAKAVEHNLPFLNRILAFLENRNLNSIVYMAALIRN